MNQILSINMEPKTKGKNKPPRNNGPIEIKSIIKFFAIAILIFGVFMVGSGSYSMYKEVTSEENNPKPVIQIKQLSETEILIMAKHSKQLEKVTYQWNMDEENEIPAEGKTQVQTALEIPEGTNALIIKATDIDGQEMEYRKVYTIDAAMTIDVEPTGNELKISASGTDEISYITYRWDEEEEIKIDVNSTETEQNIEIPVGTHKLTVIAVDINNKTKTYEKEVIGTTRPQLEITAEGNEFFVIKATDEQGIKKIELIVNEEDSYVINLDQVKPLEERKEFEYKYPLTQGENKLEVTVYNEDGITETSRVKVNI